ncbi:MAG: DNA topoisomerase VI subunit B [Elusimicrobia bacterium]|nr:DNA topoisomerase VI subunit B [Candidatus Obscuribacterium magneticum]
MTIKIKKRKKASKNRNHSRKDPARKPPQVSKKKAEKNSAPAPLDPNSDSSVIHAEKMASKQREISVSEFFLKNRHLLGFDNAKKALLTTVKEAVDNSLDACEEAKILPEIKVEVVQLAEDRFRVAIEDNGPGIVREQIPKIFGKLLYGSKFHAMKQSRGQQGIGISAAGMFGQLTTGLPTKITSRISSKRPAHYFEIHIDTNRNVPVVLKDEIVTWEKKQGTRVEIELEAKYLKGRHSVDDYIRQTALANPHLTLIYLAPDGEKTVYERSTKKLPVEPRSIKPHPHGVELGILMKMLKSTKSRRVKAFLSTDFARVSPRVAAEILKIAEISEKASPTSIAHHEADKLHRAINSVKMMNPSTDCLSPIGEGEILKGVKANIEADFYTSVTRPPAVYRGNPFQIEVALAYGGSLPKEELSEIMRFANRVPLLYQQSACAITKSVLQTAWRNYGVDQPRGALPLAPMVVLVHMASVWVPFTSESKEAVASYDEIIKEMRLGIQECGRRLEAYLRRGLRELEARRKKDYIRSYLPHIGIGLREILRFSNKEETKVVNLLTEIMEKNRS